MKKGSKIYWIVSRTFEGNKTFCAFEDSDEARRWCKIWDIDSKSMEICFVYPAGEYNAVLDGRPADLPGTCSLEEVEELGN